MGTDPVGVSICVTTGYGNNQLTDFNQYFLDISFVHVMMKCEVLMK